MQDRPIAARFQYFRSPADALNSRKHFRSGTARLGLNSGSLHNLVVRSRDYRTPVPARAGEDHDGAPESMSPGSAELKEVKLLMWTCGPLEKQLQHEDQIGLQGSKL
jgi:hypothetical protein